MREGGQRPEALATESSWVAAIVGSGVASLVRVFAWGGKEGWCPRKCYVRNNPICWNWILA
jgi:hypothetical protein